MIIVLYGSIGLKFWYPNNSVISPHLKIRPKVSLLHNQKVKKFENKSQQQIDFAKL